MRFKNKKFDAYRQAQLSRKVTKPDFDQSRLSYQGLLDQLLNDRADREDYRLKITLERVLG